MAWPMLFWKQEANMNSTREMEDSSTAVQQSGSLRLLVVEDSDIDTEILVGYLGRSGYSVHFRRVQSAATMEEALSEEEWDLVICDYWLPGFDVIHALALVKKHKLDLPFIVVSGAVGETLAVEVMRAGAHDYIMKAVSYTHLRAHETGRNLVCRLL